MDASDFPKMQSFEIEVTESWTDSDKFKSSQTFIRRFADLKHYYEHADCRSGPEREYFSKDFGGLLRLTYLDGLAEKRMSKPILYDGRVGDSAGIRIRAVCRIKYKPEKSSVPKLEATS